MSSLREDLVLISKASENIISDACRVINDSALDHAEWSIYIETLDEHDKEIGSSLFRVVNWVGSSVVEARSYSESLSDLDEAIGRIAKNNPEVLTGWIKIKNFIPKLSEYFVNRKEEEIKSRFNRVSEFSITLDARPIYTMDRDEIVKLIYPHIVKIVTSDEQEFICEFYEEQFDSLIEELTLAKKKLELLKSKFN